MRQRLPFLIPVCLLLLVALPAPLARAFDTEGRWMASDSGDYASYVDYQIHPNLDARLNAPNGGNVQNAAGQISIAATQWSQPSPFRIVRSFPWSENHPNAISTADFSQGNPCGGPPNDGEWATTCWDPHPTTTGRQTQGRIYLNTSARYRWNTAGTHNATGAIRQSDVLTVVLHELGHTLGLNHDCVYYNPVSFRTAMCFQGNQAQQVLGEDDKQGIVQLYGPYTDWEEYIYQARGMTDSIAYSQTVSGATLSAVGAENNVPTMGGSRYGRIAGTSNSSYSFAYMNLFTYQQDLDQIYTPDYVKIMPGMQLHWRQYNFRQETMSLDIEFTDGSTLRDSFVLDNGTFRHLRDNYCISVHPAERTRDCFMQYVSTEGRWVEYFVDLSPLAGKRINRIFIAYDNGQSGIVDSFRAYFEDLYLGIPGDNPVRGYTLGSGSVSVSPPGPTVPQNTVVTYTATPSAGWIHTGWLVDGRKVGWPNPLTVTMDVRHTVTAIFDPFASDFSDVPPSHPYYQAIRQLAARRIIRGYGDGTGNFGPNDTVLRAQMAAFIARGVDWDSEEWGNPFTDKCDPPGSGSNCIDDALWRNVGTLNHYNVARGYTDPATCAPAGVPCYDPRANVLYAQSISFITRAMVTKGYWQQQSTNPSIYGGVLNGTGHEQDVTTYCHYVGPVPGTASCSSSWSTWNQAATRGWFAQAEWQALDGYLRQDRVP